MSYDLVVWEGNPPASSSEAERTFEELMDADEARADRELPPGPLTPAIDALLRDLTTCWRDGIDMDESSPWAMSHLRDAASGRLAYFTMSTSPLLDEAVDYIAHVARGLGLVCYDPQREEIIS